VSAKPAVVLDGFWQRQKAWFDALVREHNLVNTVWLNLHPVVEKKIYRSAQPTPWRLARLVERYGFKSVINLRGAKPHRAVYALEKRACESLGVALLDVSIFSRRIPDQKTLLALREAFERAEYPVLMHCKAGADRSSLASALYLHWFEVVGIEEAARRQLRFWPYGYIARSGAGVIRAYFEAFAAYEKRHPGADIIEWAAQWNDRDRRKAFERDFYKSRRSRAADFIFEKILGRE
jgi:protein tyrosine phosphatase (PTP) superfamily phosphohydrolase (DUF442 family)